MPVTSWPRIETSPVSGVSSPAMIRSRVDLPLPLGPSRAVSEPPAMASETLSTATKPLSNRLVTWRTAIDIRDLLVFLGLEDVHEDEREHGKRGEHERGRVGGHLVEAQVLLVDVQRQRLGLAGEPARDDSDGAVLAEGAGHRQHDAVGDAPANGGERDAEEGLEARGAERPGCLVLVGP